MHFRGVKHREVARGALWNGLGYLFGGILAVAYPVLLLKWLGRSDYGIVSYIALLVNQSYLLCVGINEAMAQRITALYSQGRSQEVVTTIRAALFAVWMVSLTLGVLWELVGVQTIAAVLSITEGERAALYAVRFWTVPAIWGIQTGVLLGWIPVALGRFRWAALNTVLQAAWQGAFPLIVLSFSTEKSPVLALRSILLGYFLYGVNLWLLSVRNMHQWLFPGAPSLIPLLLKAGFWSTLRALISLPYQFLERTLIARWASLSLMGFYSAVYILLSRISALVLKGTEALFPIFGSVVDSPTRQGLRLGQTVWFMSVASGVLSLCGWALLVLILPLLPIRIEAPERMMIAAGVAGLVLYIPSVPVSAFLQSRGNFRFFFWVSVPILGSQLLATPILVRMGLFFFPSIIGAVVGMGLYSSFLLRKRGSGPFWRRWVLPTYLKLCIVMGLAILVYTQLPLLLPRSISGVLESATLFGLGIGFAMWDFGGRLAGAKKDFMRQLLYALRGLAESAWRRVLSPAWQTTLDNR